MYDNTSNSYDNIKDQGIFIFIPADLEKITIKLKT